VARPKGSTSRNGVFLLKRLKDVLGEDFDPFVKMAQIASDDDHNDQFQALKELLNYIQPKLKSVELSPGTDEDGKDVEWKVKVIKTDARTTDT
jgi:hypothetical protein